MNTNSRNIISTFISFGIPPASATIIHQLLISPPYQHSHTSLHEQTGLSKAAITGGLRYLETLGVISYRADSSTRRQTIAVHTKPLITYVNQRLLLFDKLADELSIAATKQTDMTLSSNIAAAAGLCSTINEVIWQAITAWENR